MEPQPVIPTRPRAGLPGIGEDLEADPAALTGPEAVVTRLLARAHVVCVLIEPGEGHVAVGGGRGTGGGGQQRALAPPGQATLDEFLEHGTQPALPLPGVPVGGGGAAPGQTGDACRWQQIELEKAGQLGPLRIRQPSVLPVEGETLFRVQQREQGACLLCILLLQPLLSPRLRACVQSGDIHGPMVSRMDGSCPAKLPSRCPAARGDRPRHPQTRSAPVEMRS